MPIDSLIDWLMAWHAEVPSPTNVPDVQRVCAATAIMFSTDYAEGNLMGLNWVPQLITFNQQPCCVMMGGNWDLYIPKNSTVTEEGSCSGKTKRKTEYTELMPENTSS